MVIRTTETYPRKKQKELGNQIDAVREQQEADISLGARWSELGTSRTQSGKMYPILSMRCLHSSSTFKKYEFLCSQGASLNLTFGACEFHAAHTLHLHRAQLVERWSGWAKSSSQPPRAQSIGMIRWVHRQPKYT